MTNPDKVPSYHPVLKEEVCSLLLFKTSVRYLAGVDLANFEAVRFIRDLAQKEHSVELAQLASRMASAIRFGSANGDQFRTLPKQ